MLGELHREAADTARPGIDQHALAARDLTGGDDTGPGAQPRNRDRARVDLVQSDLGRSARGVAAGIKANSAKVPQRLGSATP